MNDLTRDVFLGGALAIRQPRDGYRAATDPVLLAAAVGARPGQSVLELGCGVGVAALALARRVPGLDLWAIERQAPYAELARLNAQENGLQLHVEIGDLAKMPVALRRTFDHVMANPPYYLPASPAARDPGRDAALREETPLEDWIDAALRRLRQGGHLTLIHLADRLPRILAALEGRAGAIAVRPISARVGREAGRVLVCARKGARGPFRLLSPLVMHNGDSHRHDGNDFSTAAQALLRDGASMGWE